MDPFERPVVDFNVVVRGQAWDIRMGAPRFAIPPRLAVATTWGADSLFPDTFVPDARSLAHEFSHVVNTNDFHYAVSWTVDTLTCHKLIKSAYWRNQEVMANAFGEAHKADPEFQAVVDLIRAKYPGLGDGDVSHSL